MTTHLHAEHSRLRSQELERAARAYRLAHAPARTPERRPRLSRSFRLAVPQLKRA